MKALYLFILVLFSLASKAQEGPYKFSYYIDSVMQADTVSWKHQTAAWSYSYIGAYKEALIVKDIPYQSQRTIRTKEKLDSLLQKPKTILAAFRPVPAQEYILREAAKTRIVIINEAHHNSRHRVFAESLLAGLHGLGYDYMGIETLSYDDSFLNERKYPVIESGYYSKEPCFGNMIRTALKLGYTLFPYEDRTGTQGAEREMEQAENIAGMIGKIPGAKFLIYCGFDHVVEDSMNSNWVLAMAGRVKRLTGIDPLTIDQVALTETADMTYDNLYRQASGFDYSAVLLDSNYKAFNKAAPGKKVDAHVYHPTTRYVGGRPDWLLTDGKELFDISDQVTIKYPVLVLVYNNDNEAGKAVPLDVIEMKSKEEGKKLVTDRNGSKVIVLTNAKGEQQTLKIK